MADQPVAAAPPTVAQRAFPCRACGASLVYQPGDDALSCPYCQHQEPIPRSAQAIREFALAERRAPVRSANAVAGGERLALACAQCGARIEVPRDTAAKPCPYCGGSLLAVDGAQARAAEVQVAYEGVLPFAITRAEAETRVRAWLGSLWFAPDDLKRAVSVDRFSSLYLPWYTFDSHTISHYSGEAGYTYTEVVGEGKDRRTVQRVRWEYREGVLEAFYDDVLVAAGAFRAWAHGYDLTAAVPFEPAYLAGHSATAATIEPDQGWTTAKAEIDTRVENACRQRIGGDLQRNLQVTTAHRAVTFKLLLLPRWQGGYRYGGTSYQIVVNGQNGGIAGDRPWSVVKILAAGLAVAAVIAGVVYLQMHHLPR